MNIKSLSNLKYNRISKRYNLFYPRLLYNFSQNLQKYEVQEGEEMRIDLVMKSIYSYDISIEDADVILFINGIDNPINIKKGDIIFYPLFEELDGYRCEISDKSRSGENVRRALSAPNKSTKTDPNRKKFVDDGYLLIPTLTDSEKDPIRLEGDKIVIGGLN